MLSRNILSWLVLLLTLATVTRSEHYHIVPVDSTDLCNDYQNGTCFTLEQLVQTYLLSGGDNLTLSFLPGDHELTEQFMIRNFSHVHITGQKESTTVVRFHSNGTIRFDGTAALNIERLGFVGANVGERNSRQSVLIDGSNDIYIDSCYFSDFELLNQVEAHNNDVLRITNTQTATIESTLFMNNTGRALHVEADDVHITNSVFTRNNGGAVDIESNNSLINNTEFNNNSAEIGGAVELASGTVVITWCNFTNNKAYLYGGAIYVSSGNSMFISDCTLTNNAADYGGAIYSRSRSMFISDSTLTNNTADYGGAIYARSRNVFISDCELTNNRAKRGGGAIHVYKAKNVSIFNSTLTNNKADGSGGAIHVESGSVSISNCELTKNKANYDGGAIHVGSKSVFITDCELTSNRARRRGGAIHVYKGQNVSISNSTLTNNKANRRGGAIHVYKGQNVSISNSTLTNNKANRRGGAIHVYKGQNVSISNSTLTNNKANGSGGAIHVESGSVSISNCELTKNIADYDGGAIHVGSKSVFITDCELTSNRARRRGGAIHVYKGKNVSISNSTLTNNKAAYGTGGAIRVESGSFLSIFESKLTNNSAKRSGGAIYMQSGNVSISECKLTNNRAKRSGGAIYVRSGNVSISDSTFSGNVSISEHNVGVYEGEAISDSTLTNNYGTVIAVSQSTLIINNTNITNSNGPIYALDSRVEFNGPTILSNNRGVLGGAISLDQSQIYINTEGVIITNNTAISGGGIFLRESTLFVNKPIKIYQNTAHNGGGIYAHSSRVEFEYMLAILQSTTNQSVIAHNIAKNNGGGIHAVSSTIKLTQSYVNIDSNTANANGGGLYLQHGSKLYLRKQTEEYRFGNQLYVKLMIDNNSAQYGGGIFVEDDTQRSACRGRLKKSNAIHTIFAGCFIQTIKLYDISIINPNNKNFLNTFMTNNTATQSGADIYGGLLDRCTANRNAEYHTFFRLDYIKRTVKPSTKLSISSSPVQVIVCNYSQSDYNSTRKGHTYKISVMAVDQVGNPMNTTIHSSVITKSGVGRLKEGQAEQTVGNQCTELEYNVFSQDSSAQVELYADGPCINLGISRQLINISFLPCTCSIGLKPIQSDIECKCDCDPVLQQDYLITHCSEENGTMKLESNIWIKVANTTNGSGYVVSNCTFDYCVQKPVNINLSNPDEQCAYNRSGVLCGECKPGLSLVLATSRCAQCSDVYLLLLIPFALAGILLVALILVLNITIATGNIHGLIFYANIVAANRAIFFPSVNNFLTVFVSWVNLDLGIEICFYNGMSSQGKALIQLVFPTYLFVLMFLIILLSKYFDSFSKLLSNRNPVATLGTLVLLSYSKFLRFIVAALQFTDLHYPDGSTKVVWLFDGNVQYFTPNHIPQLVAAIIILIAGGLFTVMLFFGQWLPRCSEVMIWTKNTYYNGFMDAYHAPFTPKHRYWVGLLLFALITHNLVAAMDTDTSLPVLSAGCIAFGLISLNNRVYKKRLNEYLEALFLLNLGILSIGTSYVVETRLQQETLTIVSMSIAFILFVTIISYHFHHFILNNTKIWLKIKEATKNLRTTTEKKNQQPKNAMAMHQFAANDDDEQLNNAEQTDIVNLPPYTNGAVEEADPDRYITPPIIRPATRPEQLRLSYMDELAPLTTDDYRPAPPPQRVNRRPVVTYTEISGPCAQ
ncbi:probable outer membrane protein PmpB [Halichondria panicea]|uniref:probable outer membrane protein PmpB n=1 Tax=Halichondria panicea TaxID=6063 RepID=UPI00312B5CA7